ncbi:MAG TPA: gliding motility protein GldL [Bacteroidales bacterium]|nr:gliding motility protein GldL [Bacteroidales bacterium]
MGLNSQMQRLMQSKGFKGAMTKLYGFGASVVVLGALFKLEHWAGADYMLTAGLVTEAVIFFFYAFEQQEEEHPPLVYPNVILSADEEMEEVVPRRVSKLTDDGNGSIALARFDEMLINGDITPDLLLRFGDGLRKLGDTAEHMNTMGDVFAASTRYMKTIELADESLERLAKAYESSILRVTSKTVFKYQSIASSLTTIEEEAKKYQSELESLSKNLNTLNSIYRVQVQGAEEYLKDMAESAIETKKYKEQMIELNNNLTTLNKNYKNMIGLMKKD